MERIIPYIMENKKCLEPPTSYDPQSIPLVWMVLYPFDFVGQTQYIPNMLMEHGHGPKISTVTTHFIPSPNI